MKKINLLIVTLLICNFCLAQKNKKVIYKSKEYNIYADEVNQGNKFVAKAVSNTQLSSNYTSFDKPALSDSALQNWKLT